MFYVYCADVVGRTFEGKLMYRSGFFNSILGKDPTSTFDKATQFDTYAEADSAAKAAGWKRYVILNSDPPASCPCREMIDPENF